MQRKTLINLPCLNSQRAQTELSPETETPILLSFQQPEINLNVLSVADSRD
jgi:hypothetical protein